MSLDKKKTIIIIHIAALVSPRQRKCIDKKKKRKKKKPSFLRVRPFHGVNGDQASFDRLSLICESLRVRSRAAEVERKRTKKSKEQ